MRKKRKKEPTAGKSFLLTLKQLVFLAEKPNASEWVRGAIDQAMRIEAREIFIVKPGKGHWSRLIKEGMRPTLNEPWSKVVKLGFDVAEAHEAMGFNEESFKKFQSPGWDIVRLLEALLRGG